MTYQLWQPPYKQREENLGKSPLPELEPLLKTSTLTKGTGIILRSTVEPSEPNFHYKFTEKLFFYVLWIAVLKDIGSEVILLVHLRNF